MDEIDWGLVEILEGKHKGKIGFYNGESAQECPAGCEIMNKCPIHPAAVVHIEQITGGETVTIPYRDLRGFVGLPGDENLAKAPIFKKLAKVIPIRAEK